MIAQQTATQTQLGAVQTQVNTVVTQTAPVIIPPTPTPVPAPIVVDKASSCGKLKQTIWELWSESDFAQDFNLTYHETPTHDLFLQYQGGAHDSEYLLYCPSTWDDQIINGVPYKKKGCQKFISENPEWFACMTQ